MTGESNTQGHILVVEDEWIVACDLADTLSSLGYSVAATVASGEEAVEKARELLPALILMDIRLAGAMDGVHAAQRIRRERDVPIIYLTAHSDDETLRRAKETEPSGYLVKPFKGPELRCAIEIALHKHEIEARLREREEWLATTLRSIGDGVVATDADQRINFLNPVAEALTGWRHEDAIGMELDEILKLVSENGHAPIESPVRSALENKRAIVLQRDALLVPRGGGTIPIDENAAPILNSQGEILGGVMVFRDATEKRRRDEEVRRLNAELERRVVERTQQLEAANKEMEAFSYSVAHDLRAPLRGIEGFSQALIEDHAANLGPQGLEHLHRVRRATQRMAHLIEDLLQLARVVKTDLHLAEVNLSELARTVATGLKAAHPNQPAAVEIHGNIVVQGDERLLRIVLENLLGNSWKFTSRVERPRIEVGSLDRGGTRICFVKDNGVGFDMRHAHKLFGAFQRLHTVSEFEGTGIGLAIVQRIIVRHGGRIWAESSVGQGTTFYFLL